MPHFGAKMHLLYTIFRKKAKNLLFNRKDFHNFGFEL